MLIFVSMANVELLQKLAPAVLSMVSDLDYIKCKVTELRRRWDVVKSYQNLDTDFGFSDVSMDRVGEDERKSKFKGSLYSFPSDDAEVKQS